ncbi:MAG: T9SS type A sorting domain-containing protein [Saprospiraceae bacterium]|nr:MAG: T9SS type A sorting domain-containing protein [Saprospiraceae bacterium]
MKKAITLVSQSCADLRTHPLTQASRPNHTHRILHLMLLLPGVLFWNNETAAQANCTMACNNLVSVALPSSCEAEVTYDMILEGNSSSSCTPNGPTSFNVTVKDANGVPIPTSPIVNAAYIGQTLTVLVEHWPTGNYCWGHVIVEDNLAPQMTCPADVTIACSEDSEPVNTGNPIIVECSPYSLTHFDNSQINGCSGNYAAVITRTWTAVDNQGNSNTCTQVINVAQGNAASVVFPLNLDDIESPSLDCVNPNTMPINTGYPTIGGTPIPQNGGGLCNMAYSYDDQQIAVCQGSFTILRNWVVVAWCSGTVLSDMQIIAVKDKTAPVLTCPADLTVSTNSSQFCNATVSLPQVGIADDCSTSFYVYMNTPGGYVVGNGGIINNVPVGVHTITYTVVDDCDNSASCSVQLTVKDQTPPTVICDSYTVVTLTNMGFADVFATTFDDGSYDNCSSTVYFSARRMTAACGTQPVFGPTVKFCCEDVGTNVTVVMQVTDYFGNANSCMVTVHVDDKTPPLIACPANITISCTQDYSDTGLTGEPTVTEACDIDTLYYTEVVDLNLCDIGTVTRTWHTADVNGNAASCSHVITLEDTTPPTITFPPNYAVVGCFSADDLAPANLPAPYNAPVITSDCELMATSFTDQIFTVAPPACFKIVRTWKVLNWCTYQPNNGNAGIWQAQQIIMVTDTTAPSFTCPAGFTVSVGNSCTATVALPQVTNIQDCSQDVTVEVLTNLGFGSGPFQNIAPGSYGATYIVADGCGNSSNCTIAIEVVDDKKPTPFCKNGLVIDLMNSQPPMIAVGASDFDAGSFDNCTGHLVISFSADTTDVSAVYTCGDIGQQPIQMWVTDAVGNQDYCETFLVVQDNLGNCTSPLFASVGGAVVNEMGYNVEYASVSVNDTINEPVLTGPDGNFLFPEILIGSDYTVTPEKNSALLNGVTTYDLVVMRRHILDIEHLPTPYKMIAADVNHSGGITTSDMVDLQKVILHVTDTIPNNHSWRFVDAAYVFPDPLNPWTETIPEVYNINNLSSNMDSVNFIAVKIGDLNGSAIPNQFYNPPDERSGETLTLRVNDAFLQPGKEQHIDFTASNFHQIIGYQFTLNFDPGALEFVRVETGDLPSLTEANFGFRFVEDGALTTSWNDFSAHDLPENAVLFSLVFKPKSAIYPGAALRISSDFTAAEAYHENGELLGVNLEFEAPSGTQQLTANTHPNPFRGKTIVSFTNPADQEVTLTVFDASGRVLKTVRGTFTAGYGEFEIEAAALHGAGSYFYRLETSSDAVTGKLLLMD